ncbi:MAG: polysaccharide biosynthesis tyrosine autokinase [Oscillospiraceae bacterium]|nr:polysaccharide biosynthesis tyrosine autokinase [Oscillospiraceae bacterium]
MNDRMINRDDEREIDLQQVFAALISKAWLIGLVSVVCAVVTFLGTLFFITPQYRSAAMFYVNNNSMSLGDVASSITSSDVSASRSLVKSYIVILNTRETLNDVIDYAELNRTYQEVKSMISAEAVDATEIFQVVVTSPDANEAEAIANGIAYILPKRITSIMDGTSAKVVEAAVVPSKPSSPSYTKNTMVGLLLGLLLSSAAVILWTVMDTTIRKEDDVTQNCKYPVLAAVPDMEAQGKGHSNYSYDRDKKNAALQTGKKHTMIGKDMSFAAAEAYKLLRTKLQFAFADENDSHVIGISSSLSGEGKSLSAVNLAYSLSQLGKCVVLIDCDMRRPTLAEKLKIQKKPGLSNFLTGQCGVEEMIQYCNIPGDEKAFRVITAGPNPPNPIELLSSDRMNKFLIGLRKICDYVILDLPPVGEVSDALAAAGNTDGMLLVVRQNQCEKNILADTVRQFEFVDAKILGVVYNCAEEGGGKYGKGYYRKYYNRYYASAANKQNDKKQKETKQTDKKLVKK